MKGRKQYKKDFLLKLSMYGKGNIKYNSEYEIVELGELLGIEKNLLNEYVKCVKEYISCENDICRLREEIIRLKDVDIIRNLKETIRELEKVRNTNKEKACKIYNQIKESLQ